MLTVTYGAVTLYSAADDSHEFVGGVAVPASQIVEPAGLALATAESYGPRGNLSTQPAFTVRRLFASVEAAELFCHDLPTSLPASGDLVFTYSAGVVRRYPSACFTSATAQQSITQGKLVSIAYQFAAGPASNS